MCGRSSSLLGYLHPSHRTRNIIHLRRNRRSGGCLFSYFCLYVSILLTTCRLFFSTPPKVPTEPNTYAVFQPKLDILGMVIYASEFVLWSGVFACGGYFNLMPWAKQKLRERKEEKENRNSGVGMENADGNGISNDISLHRMPSSTSVFRTPSSVARCS